MNLATLADKTLAHGLIAGAAAVAMVLATGAVRDASARVGVTSATDGDPLGKPPTEAERVLRIGVDVQANELITTAANDRAHLVFLDGSSLTVGPNAQLVIDKFVFDPTSKTGELAINASRGVLRLVGGKISKTSPIVITTPSSTIGIRGGITLLDVKAAQTGSVFIFGRSMTVTAAGITENVTRQGSQVITNLGQPPGAPTLLTQGALAAQLSQLEGRSGSGSSAGSGGGAGNRGAVDQAARSSGISNVNSSQPVRIVGLRPTDSFGSGPGPANRNPNDTIPTALSQTNQQQQQQQAVQDLRTEQAASHSSGIDYNSILGVFEGFDFNQLQILPNSEIATVNQLNQLNMQGATATYSGPTFALMDSGQTISGTYSNVWSFGNRNGIAKITLGPATYGGGSAPNTAMSGNGPVFTNTQSLQGPAGQSINSLVGVFLSTPNQPASQQIGAYTVSGPNQQGYGIFSGKR
ncbi:MAG: FecR family protein [Pseudomonadota bacterium]